MPRDTDDSETSRRRFLKATGAATLTSAVAGCGSGGNETETPDDGGDQETETNTGTDTGPVNVDGYPYGVGETKV
ncbi:twin-arginine translocation signal domain-containing protein [Halosimplex sp. J119]